MTVVDAPKYVETRLFLSAITAMNTIDDEEAAMDCSADFQSDFDQKSHIEYFQACLKVLPHYYVGLDTTRLSAVYFCTLGLDILGAGLKGDERESVIEFVYSNQLDSNLDQPPPGYCGFIGSSYCGQTFGGCCRSPLE